MRGQKSSKGCPTHIAHSLSKDDSHQTLDTFGLVKGGWPVGIRILGACGGCIITYLEYA